MIEYSSIRLDRDTLERLTRFRDRLAARCKKSPRGSLPPHLDVPTIGLGAAVRELLRRDDEHAARGRQHHSRR